MKNTSKKLNFRQDKFIPRHRVKALKEKKNEKSQKQ